MATNQDKNNFNLNLFDDVITSTSTSISKAQKNLELKIDWFVRVLDSLEKLTDKNSELENKIHNNRTYLTSNIASTREYIYIELKNLRSDCSECKEKHHFLVESTKNNLEIKIDKVTIKIDTEIRRIEDKIIIEISKKLERLNIKVDKLNDTIISIRIKMATIGTIGGLVGSICLFITQFLFKKYF